jgi:hypothetical protein
MFLKPHDFFSSSVVCNKCQIMLFLFKPCATTFFVLLLCSLQSPWNFFPLGTISMLSLMGLHIQIEGVPRTMVYYGHHLVYVNDVHHHLFGSLIGPTVLSFFR